MMAFAGLERPGRQMIALLGLALGAAVVSNALAGPTRRLSWLLPPPPPPLSPRGMPVPTPSSPAPPTTASLPAAQAKAKPASASKPPAQVEAKPASPAPASLQSRFPTPPGGAPVEIDGAAAQELFRLGARFVDARRTTDFQAGHVPGATSLPVWEDGLEAKLQDLDATTKDPSDPLVIYCAGGGCRDSHELAQKLWLMGFRNLRIYTGGWPEWHEKGWPSATGTEGLR